MKYYLDCFLFLLIRLDPTADGEDIQLIRDLFDGGEARRMGPSSVAVQIEKRILLNDYTPDTFHYWQSGDHAVTVQIFQSLQAGEILSCEAMDAMLQLFINRDQQMCEAYVQVNEKKTGYIQRLESMYVKSFFSSKLKRDHPIADMLREPQIAFCVEKQFFLKPYRCIMPLLWDAKNEWILIVIEASVRAVQIIYPKYVSNVAQSSSGDERVAYSIVLREILFAILSASEIAHATNVPWDCFCIYNSPGTNDSLKGSTNHRIPDGMDCGLTNHLDSGLYILYAIECDYYDSPIFATLADDYDNIRMKLAHCLLNKQLII